MRNMIGTCLVVGLAFSLAACQKPATEPEAQSGPVERTTPQEQSGPVERTEPQEQSGPVERTAPPEH